MNYIIFERILSGFFREIETIQSKLLLEIDL